MVLFMILQKRNTVNFDPSIKPHRMAAMQFMKRNAWVDSPLRFNYDPEYGSIADQVKTKMLYWYIEQEKKRIK